MELDGAVSRVIPAAGHGVETSEQPALSPNVDDAKFVTVPGSPSKSLAEGHLPALNVARPSRPQEPTCTQKPAQMP